MIRLLAAAVLALAALIGCTQPPVPGRVIVAGDSVAWQGGYTEGSTGYWATSVYTFWGATAADGRPYVAADVADPAKSPQVLVMAYGHNYYPTGITPDVTAELDGMASLPHPTGTCLVIVLPGYVGSDAQRIQLMADYQTWATSWRDTHPGHVVLVDWASAAAASPDYLMGDGVHLTTPGAAAFADLVNQGTYQCLGGRPGN